MGFILTMYMAGASEARFWIIHPPGTNCCKTLRKGMSQKTKQGRTAFGANDVQAAMSGRSIEQLNSSGSSSTASARYLL